MIIRNGKKKKRKFNYESSFIFSSIHESNDAEECKERNV